MKPEKMQVLVISTAHITKQDGEQLMERSYSPDDSALPPAWHIIPATDYYGHWLWAGDYLDKSSCDERCSAAEEEGYSELFVGVLRFAHQNHCSHLRFDCDGPVYGQLPTEDW